MEAAREVGGEGADVGEGCRAPGGAEGKRSPCPPGPGPVCGSGEFSDLLPEPGPDPRRLEVISRVFTFPSSKNAPTSVEEERKWQD